MIWDPSVSLEGLATALGILGAAIGYLINLGRSWRMDRQDKLRRGTYTVILELLEERIVLGMTEDELWNRYCGAQGKDLRRVYGGFEVAKINQVTFHGLIRDLRLDRLIEMVGKDRYRLETRHIDRSELERVAAEDIASVPLDRDVLRESILARVAQGQDSWEIRRWLELLPRIDPPTAIPILEKLLESADAKSPWQSTRC